MSTQALPPIPSTRQPLIDREVGYLDWINDLFDTVSSYFVAPPPKGLFDDVAPLETSASPEMFARYVGNIQAELNEIGRLDSSRVEARTQCYNKFAGISAMRNIAADWMKENKTYNFSPVNAVFQRADELKARVIAQSPKADYTVPEAPLRESSPISKVSPGMKNQGNTCYLASLFQGLMGDPVTRQWIIDADFVLDPLSCPGLDRETTEEGYDKKLTEFKRHLEVLERTLKGCAYEYQEAQRHGRNEPFTFLKEIRTAIDPFVRINLSRGGQEDPTEVLCAILNHLNSEANPLFSQMIEYKIFETQKDQLDGLEGGNKALAEFGAFVRKLRDEGAGAEGVIDGLKAFLTYVDPETKYDELNDAPGILRAVLVKLTTVTKDDYYRKIITNNLNSLKKNYVGRDYKDRIAELEEEVASKASDNEQAVAEIADEKSLPELIGLTLGKLSDLQKLPEIHQDANQNTPEVRNTRSLHKEALRKVNINGHTHSNAFESFLDAAFYESNEGSAYLDFLERTPNHMQLKVKQKRQAFEKTPEYLFMNLNRDGHNGTRAIKDNKKVYLEETFYLDPKFCVDGTGGEYQIRWFCVHLGSGPSGGHYVNYRLTEKGWFCHNDKSSSPVDIVDVQKKLQDCVLIFANKTDREMSKEQIDLAIEERIETALGKDNEQQFADILQSQRGEGQELSLINLFGSELSRKVPNIELLKNIYVSLVAREFEEFPAFVEFALNATNNFEEMPIEEQLVKLKDIDVDLLGTKLKNHIVAQYIKVREQRREHALDATAREKIDNASISTALRKMEALQDALTYENKCLTYLLTRNEVDDEHWIFLMKTLSPSLFQKFRQLYSTWETGKRHTMSEYATELQRLIRAELEPVNELIKRIKEFSEQICKDVNEFIARQK